MRKARPGGCDWLSHRISFCEFFQKQLQQSLTAYCLRKYLTDKRHWTWSWGKSLLPAQAQKWPPDFWCNDLGVFSVKGKEQKLAEAWIKSHQTFQNKKGTISSAYFPGLHLHWSTPDCNHNETLAKRSSWTCQRRLTVSHLPSSTASVAIGATTDQNLPWLCWD